MIHVRLPSLPKLVLFVVGVLLVVDCLAKEDTKTGADEDQPKSKKKSKGKDKNTKAEETDTDDEKDVEGEAVVDG